MRSARQVTCGLLGAVLTVTGGVRMSPAETEAPRGKAQHVVLVVWDGMRPDFVTEKYAPTLWKLAQEGVTFRRHHSVYPTLTTVNATVLATGVHPSQSGRIGNYEYQPQLSSAKPARMDDWNTARKGDAITGGKYVAVATIAEIVQAHGGRTAVAGTKSAPLLFDRKEKAAGNGARSSVTLAEGKTQPASAQLEMRRLLGRFPKTKALPSVLQDRWTTRALTEVLWKDGVPELSVLWMGDPDRSEHGTMPGSETSLAGIRSADRNLALVLDALQRKEARADTDIFVVSDHGFSTVARSIDVARLLKKGRFSIVKEGEPSREAGDIRMIGNGGTNLFYVGEHDAVATKRLVEWLQASDFAGVIFSRSENEGTFPLSQVHLETADGPDVVLAFRWDERLNKYGVAGMIDANRPKDPAAGTHGTLSAFDVHNLLIAAGPDFKQGAENEAPSSNLDVAPTILHLLGLKAPHPLPGRVLHEALAESPEPMPTAIFETSEATRAMNGKRWRQYLRVTEFGGTTYIDEGNGGAD